MNRKIVPLAILSIDFLLAGPRLARAQPPTLTLEDYLSQVRLKNQDVKGALQSAEGAAERSRESALITSPAFFANANWVSDRKPNPTPLFTYDKLNTDTYSLGFSQTTSFGLQAKLSYNLNYTNYVNPSAGGTPLPYPPYYDAHPTIELVQSLWGNGFGRGTRANVQATEAQALATSYSSRFRARSALVDAETTYWRMALARKVVAIQTEVLERAKKFFAWSSRRAKLNLADKVDAMQAEAALRVREIELQSALNEQRAAALSFNSVRGIESDVMADELVTFGDAINTYARVPGRAALRDDVKAADEQRRYVEASATASRERDSATFDVLASYAFNAQRGSIPSAFGAPFTDDRPTQSVGFRLTIPLDFGAVSSARQGWAMEGAAADQIYQRRVFEQERTWTDLVAKLAEAKRQVELAQTVETAQKQKLDYEKIRLTQGRTTTLQILLFETDYEDALLSRVRTQAAVLVLTAQLKLFGESL